MLPAAIVPGGDPGTKGRIEGSAEAYDGGGVREVGVLKGGEPEMKPDQIWKV